MLVSISITQFSPYFMMNATINHGGYRYTLRAVSVNDAIPLAEYFTALSEDTKRRFQPHPLTSHYASILTQSPSETAIRTILLDGSKVIGYFILETAMSPHEAGRFAEHGIELVSGLDVLFAPSILDEYQNKGLASEVMPILIDFLKRKNFRSLVLMGGTQETNRRAIAFYEKFGFVKCGGYQTEFFNHDMQLVIS
ncbi:MAG: GNAT family N-acetyltransferase [Candidatus Kapabacteria bacterium]|nr:GNAT family N-acetyltransferase [Candidatus Kapabacteria bacterium]